MNSPRIARRHTKIFPSTLEAKYLLAVRTSAPLRAYLQDLGKGPNLAVTKHAMALDGSGSMESRILWDKVLIDMGENSARRAVNEWIAKPYKLA